MVKEVNPDERYIPTKTLEEILAAFREVTGWSDEEVLHLASCDLCVPICGHEESSCKNNPAMIALNEGLTRRRGSGDPSGR